MWRKQQQMMQNFGMRRSFSDEAMVGGLKNSGKLEAYQVSFHQMNLY